MKKTVKIFLLSMLMLLSFLIAVLIAVDVSTAMYGKKIPYLSVSGIQYKSILFGYTVSSETNVFMIMMAIVAGAVIFLSFIKIEEINCKANKTAKQNRAIMKAIYEEKF